ncbi:MAG: hydroxyethylthiazole kinase [Bacteroidales bacterium]|nr:hydroxyethylthiazole kinase [Bacteroidales bacterium]
MLTKQQFLDAFKAVKAGSPLVQNITNYVAMNNSANALLAIGASPVMAHEKSEMDEMTSIAGCLVLNIGTLDEYWMECILEAGRCARRHNKPIVLDPVGAGATSLRTNFCWKVINECHPDIIRGNGSEIMALINADVKSKGVDSSASSCDALSYAKILAERTGAVVVISGQTDYITDGKRVETITNGHPMMPAVTALGCSSTSIVGAFAAVVTDKIVACTAAMALIGLAGERAAKISKGPGSLQVNILDELYQITPEILAEEARA